MKTFNLRSASALSLLVAMGAACGDDAPVKQPDGGACPINPDAAVVTPAFKQIEQLARPGIAEALLISDGFLAGYNATAPTFAGVDPTTLGAVVGEAKTVLKALYLGVCLVDGLANLTPSTGLKPAGMQCVEVGTGLFSDTGATVLKPTVVAAAQAYADQVFDQFEPDVMRTDTSVTSGYLTLCGTAATKPLLCGGRLLTDDVIDITYDYLLAGAAIDGTSPPQFQALVQDGVSFAGNNDDQGHPAVSATFPYSAPPL